MLFLFFQVFIYASSNENKKSTTNLQSSMNENRSIEQQLSKNSNMHKCISFKTNNKHSADEHSKDYNPENFTRCREKIKKKVESKIPIKVGSDIYAKMFKKNETNNSHLKKENCSKIPIKGNRNKRLPEANLSKIPRFIKLQNHSSKNYFEEVYKNIHFYEDFNDFLEDYEGILFSTNYASSPNRSEEPTNSGEINKNILGDLNIPENNELEKTQEMSLKMRLNPSIEELLKSNKDPTFEVEINTQQQLKINNSNLYLLNIIKNADAKIKNYIDKQKSNKGLLNNNDIQLLHNINYIIYQFREQITFSTTQYCDVLDFIFIKGKLEYKYSLAVAFTKIMTFREVFIKILENIEKCFSDEKVTMQYLHDVYLDLTDVLSKVKTETKEFSDLYKTITGEKSDLVIDEDFTIRLMEFFYALISIEKCIKEDKKLCKFENLQCINEAFIYDTKDFNNYNKDGNFQYWLDLKSFIKELELSAFITIFDKSNSIESLFNKIHKILKIIKKDFENDLSKPCERIYKSNIFQIVKSSLYEIRDSDIDYMFFSTKATELFQHSLKEYYNIVINDLG